MKRSHLLFLFSFLAVIAVGLFVFVDVTVAQYGLDETADAAGLTQYNDPVPVVIGNVVGAALSLIGVLFFILMVYGGIIWMLARGKEDQTKKALDTIIAAVIGIIIVLASYAITDFVLRSVEEGDGSSGEIAVNLDQGCLDLGGTCMDISSGTCGLDLTGLDGDVAGQRLECEASSASCRINLCNSTSDLAVVCCGSF